MIDTQATLAKMAFTKVVGASEEIDTLLTWETLTEEQRAQLTQAANALELARDCIRGNGPGASVSIGF